MKLKISLLTSSCKRENFDCGKDPLNNYIKKQASQDVRRLLSACYVLTNAEDEVKGYYTLSSASIPRDGMPENLLSKLPKTYNEFPATLLGRLGIDNTLQGNGRGSALLFHALKKALANADSVGSLAVIVDPLDEEAREFYRRKEFIEIPGTGRMFMLMSTIQKQVDDEENLIALLQEGVKHD